ncbi:MAG: hypothetical protein JXA42_16020 [Anaerolineales bacterium]|nr:hypothetical protein [Anaerolineales bacterium]
MKGKRFYLNERILVLLFALTLGSGLAKEPDDRELTPGEVTGDLVESKFTYQGVLSESGVPVSGARDMNFRLFSNSACTTAVSGNILMPGVEIDEGIFTVELPVSATYLNGQGLWLEIICEGASIACQEILPTPYALSLRPGARIVGEQTNWDAIHAENTATTGQSYGVYGRSYSTIGRGVNGYVSANEGESYGIYGRSDSSSGAGVYARGIDAGADLVLAGNANTNLGDDGRIVSDPDYSSSDMHLITNDGVRIDLDNDADGEDADFEIRDKDDTIIFNVDESGAVTYGGAGIPAFPRPSYDSGWLSVAKGEDVDCPHNLGGDVINYVVDMTCKSTDSDINNRGVSGSSNKADSYGTWWSDLTTSAITIHRWDEDADCPNVRLRIWVYP